MPALEDIPDEILQHVVSYVSPRDNLVRVQLASRRLNRLANEPLLWKWHCQNTFTYWDPSHNFPAKLAGKVFDVDWKALFLLRKARETRISTLFDGILATQLGRARRFEQICLLGYDAKDYLLEQSRTIDTAEDVLARRYHSHAILASLRRGLALQVWCDLRQSLTEPFDSSSPIQSSYQDLEKALSALDMFVIHDDKGDMDHTSDILNHLSIRFRETHPGLDEMSTREAALALNRWLRALDLVGMNEPRENYRNLRNCFIGHALRDDSHPSLPVISAAIFCCIAGRLGLNAHCCAMPGHIHAVVLGAPGMTLDGEPAGEAHQQGVERMYLDPYSHDREVARSDLQSLIYDLGWQSSMETLLEPISPGLLVTRMARNIKETYMALRSPMVAMNDSLADLLDGNPAENLELAVYGAAWATLVLTREDPEEFEENSRQLAFWFKPHQSKDVWLMDKFYLPLSAQILGHPSPELTQYMRQAEARPPPPRFRTNDMEYRIGQVVRHTRSDRLAIICGWKRYNSATFYDILVDDDPGGKTANPDNLELIVDPNMVTSTSFRRAGQYFKRFDRPTCCFISNIVEEYPNG